MTENRTVGDLFARAGLAAPGGNAGIQVAGITDNSRAVENGWMFIATRGTRSDGHDFASDAVRRGASVVVVEHDVSVPAETPVIRVPDSREALGLLAHAYRGNPSSRMLVFGVSGTNGKTTTTYLLESILREAGYKPGVIGTIEHRFADQHVKAQNTTPTALELSDLMARMAETGVNALAMEVSSHATDQRRIAGIEFDIGVLTNITQDHLDYHGSMEEYAAAKRRFYFDCLLRPRHKKSPEPGAAFGIDNEWAARFAKDFPARQLTFGLGDEARVRADGIEFSPNATRFEIVTDNGRLAIASKLLGQFNVQNVLGAASASLLAGIPQDAIVRGIASLTPVSGRFEQVDCGQPFAVVVDYAHTPDGLERILHSARQMTRNRVVTVFGCGGDRDPGKRPKMGRIAGDMSDIVFLTNDNPRTEDPQKIADMAFVGVTESQLPHSAANVVLDRRVAIEAAIGAAQEGDVVVIAGKGHEDYQILNTGTVHFDDREVAREVLQTRGWNAR